MEKQILIKDAMRWIRAGVLPAPETINLIRSEIEVLVPQEAAQVDREGVKAITLRRKILRLRAALRDARWIESRFQRGL